MDALGKLGISLGYLLMQFLAFFIILVLLRMWAWDPIVTFLQRRREKLAKALEDARVAAEARANAEAEAEKILAEARSKAETLIEDARKRAEEVARQVREQAEAEAKRIREQAQAEMEAERNRMLGELREQIAALAVAAAQKIVQESLDEARQRALLQEFFSGIRDKKIVVLDELGDVAGTERVEVVTAVPLTEEEQALIRKALEEKLGAVTIEYLVDPSILGGVVLRIGDRVLDGSVSRQLQALKVQLTAA